VQLVLVECDVVCCGPKVNFRLINPHPANLLSDHSEPFFHPASGDKTMFVVIQVDGHDLSSNNVALVNWDRVYASAAQLQSKQLAGSMECVSANMGL